MSTEYQNENKKSIPPRPVPASIQLENIPAQMRELRRWLVWVYQFRQGRWTKVPFAPWLDHEGKPVPADSTSDYTWGSYDQAVEFYNKYKFDGKSGFDGIGFSLHESGAVGLDQDDCRDPVTGEITPEARSRIEVLDTYTEVSPGKKGVKSLALGIKPGPRCRTGKTEMYSFGRFFTVTGNILPSSPTTLNPRQSQIDQIYHDLFPEEDKSTKTTAATSSDTWLPSDDVILDRAAAAKNGKKFSRLWEGDWRSDYGSQSDADAALVAILAYWTKGEPDRIDHLFRQSGLMRSKWDRQDYRDRTLRAVAGGDHYRWETEERQRQERLLDQIYPDPEPIADPPAAEPTEAPRREKKVWLTVDEVMDLPDPEWLIHKHLPDNSNCCIYGPSGSGKSFVALDMALSVATGRRFLGQFDVKQGPVLYIYSEGGSSAKFRIGAWRQSTGIRPENIAFGMTRFNLTDTEEAHKLLIGGCQALGCLPSLVVVDTLTRNFGGLNTDSNQDMSRYVANIDLIREKTGAVVLSVHHTGWSNEERERGAKALRDSLDACFRVLSEPESETIEIKCVKQKDDEELPPYLVKKQKVFLESGGSSLFLNYFGSAHQIAQVEKETARVTKHEEEERLLLAKIPHLPPDEAEHKAPSMDALSNSTKWHRSKVGEILKRLLERGDVIKDKRKGSNAATPFYYFQPA